MWIEPKRVRQQSLAAQDFVDASDASPEPMRSVEDGGVRVGELFHSPVRNVRARTADERIKRDLLADPLHGRLNCVRVGDVELMDREQSRG